MKIRPWLTGAAGVTAVMLGFGTSASAAVQHPASHTPSAGHGYAKNLPMAGLRLRPAGTVFGPNWAGYIAFANRNVALRYVAADFSIPSLNCANAAANATVAQFVGLEDFNVSGELTGIQGTCNSDGTSSYQAFYNIGSSGGGSTGTINPGDAIQASVYYNATTKKYTFFVNDVTQGGTPLINTTVSCPSGSSCSTATAEAITDDPFDTQTQQNFPLANYGMVNITGGVVTSRDGLKGGFGPAKLWSSSELGIKDGGGVVMATPSSLAGGTAFNTTWHAAS